jgi:hypothetical protein
VHTLPIDGERQQFVIASELWIFWEIKKFKKIRGFGAAKTGSFLFMVIASYL